MTTPTRRAALGRLAALAALFTTTPARAAAAETLTADERTIITNYRLMDDSGRWLLRTAAQSFRETSDERQGAR